MDEKERNEICRHCGKCCNVNWIYTSDFDRALRFKMLDSNGMIEVKEIIQNNLWKIIFKYKCTELVYDSKMKFFTCRMYGGLRPKYCKLYPSNFLGDKIPDEAKKEELDFCLLLKELKKE